MIVVKLYGFLADRVAGSEMERRQGTQDGCEGRSSGGRMLWHTF